MKTVLYLMHVHWHWAKQRPHFIAEGLSNYFKVDVFYLKRYKRNNLSAHNPQGKNLKVKELFLLPFAGYTAIIGFVNNYILKLQLKKQLARYDYLWITHPIMFSYAGSIPPEIKLVYDCMDDVMEFPEVKSHPEKSKKIFHAERALIERADIVFCSSDYLKEKISKRFNTIGKITVVNNGIHINKNLLAEKELVLSDNILRDFDNIGFKLVYIGTIAEWMDFDLILESLEEFSNISYYFFGPAEVDIPQHPKIKYFGPIPHKQVFNIMEKADALIMPFKLTELILSVNPVKLYEYIYSGKPAISIKYGETFKFDAFAYLYEDKKEYFEILKELTNSIGINIDKLQCEDFASENTWDKRVTEIKKKLMGA